MSDDDLTPRQLADREARLFAKPDPCAACVNEAAKRAGRWARDNTTLTAAEIIGLNLAILDLAGPS